MDSVESEDTGAISEFLENNYRNNLKLVEPFTKASRKTGDPSMH